MAVNYIRARPKGMKLAGSGSINMVHPGRTQHFNSGAATSGSPTQAVNRARPPGPGEPGHFDPTKAVFPGRPAAASAVRMP